MSDTLSIAINGLNATSQKIAKTASNIVNASSIAPASDLSKNLVNLVQDKNNYAAEAKVVKVTEQTNKALLDILA